MELLGYYWDTIRPANLQSNEAAGEGPIPVSRERHLYFQLSC